MASDQTPVTVTLTKDQHRNLVDMLLVKERVATSKARWLPALEYGDLRRALQSCETVTAEQEAPGPTPVQVTPSGVGGPDGLDKPGPKLEWTEPLLDRVVGKPLTIVDEEHHPMPAEMRDRVDELLERFSATGQVKVAHVWIPPSTTDLIRATRDAAEALFVEGEASRALQREATGGGGADPALGLMGVRQRAFPGGALVGGTGVEWWVTAAIGPSVSVRWGLGVANA